MKAIDPLPGFAEAAELAVVQPVDHQRPGGPRFTQRVFISHRGYDRPVVFHTHGYGVAWPRKTELDSALDANLIVVEHRFYGASVPDPPDWRKLSVYQAACDHHRLVVMLKRLYPGPWISTGKSKGGQSALFHRSFFPGDVDGTVAYVAPIMFSRADPRFLSTVERILGKETVERCERIQVLLLENRAELRSRVVATIDPNALYLGLEDFLDLTVVNLPFELLGRSSTSPLEVPTRPTLDRAITFYLELIDPSPYLKRNHATQGALHYQTATEIGYFSYGHAHLERLIGRRQVLDCSLLAGTREVPAFDPQVMQGVVQRLGDANPSMVLLYGAQDLWTACRLDTSGMTGSTTIVHDGAAHDVSLADLSPGERSAVDSQIQGWLRARHGTSRR